MLNKITNKLTYKNWWFFGKRSLRVETFPIWYWKDEIMGGCTSLAMFEIEKCSWERRLFHLTVAFFGVHLYVSFEPKDRNKYVKFKNKKYKFNLSRANGFVLEKSESDGLEWNTKKKKFRPWKWTMRGVK